MKPSFQHIFFIGTTIIFLMSCGGSSAVDKSNPEKKVDQKKKDNNEHVDVTKKSTDKKKSDVDNDLPAVFDATTFITDTTLYLKDYHIIIGKEKYNANKELYSSEDLEANSVLIYFTKRDNDSIALLKKFEENWYARFTSFHNNTENYVTLISFGGGSGYYATIYKIQLDPKPGFIPVASYNEIATPLFSKDGSELMLMTGIWDMSVEGDEGHFSDHKYEISSVDLTNNKFKKSTFGTTQFKYMSADEDFSAEKLFKQIHQAEPQVFKGLNLDKYPI